MLAHLQKKIMNKTTRDSKQKNNVSKSKRSFIYKFKGFFLVMVSGFFMSIQNYFMRKAEFFNAIEQTSFRYLFQIIGNNFIYSVNLNKLKQNLFKINIRK